MQNYLMNHFCVQKGMYFDRLYSGEQMCYYGSDVISDSTWNYGCIELLTDKKLLEFDSFCESINKPKNLYIPFLRGFDDTCLEKNGYVKPISENGDLLSETWMEYQEGEGHFDDCECECTLASSDNEFDDFLCVFLSAYGGEKSPENPYGDLPDEYKDALVNSFYREKFNHIICYNSDKVPVSVASLCMDNKCGGIYNVGTRQGFERQGFGGAVTKACVDLWKKKRGESLFLQTETGTGIDDWYEGLGFVKVFYGVVYEKC